MPAPLRTARVDVVDDDPVRVVCCGEFDLDSIELVVDAILELSDDRPPWMVVDFRPATFLGTAALSRVAYALIRCEPLGIAVDLDPCPFLDRLFVLLGIADSEDLLHRARERQLQTPGRRPLAGGRRG